VPGWGFIAPDFQRDTVALETSAILAMSAPLRPPSTFSSSVKRGTTLGNDDYHMMVFTTPPSLLLLMLMRRPRCVLGVPADSHTPME
jgi:hypothetical protein